VRGCAPAARGAAASAISTVRRAIQPAVERLADPPAGRPPSASTASLGSGSRNAAIILALCYRRARMSFPWLASSKRRRRRSSDAEHRAEMYRDELVQRAGLFYRLGYPPSRAIARLKGNVAWDFELVGDGRPPGLGDKDIAEIVKATYLRRPTR